jgi:hypothetical protein
VNGKDRPEAWKIFVESKTKELPEALLKGILQARIG